MLEAEGRGEERRWYVAVVSVKAVVSKPAARSMIVVSWSGWAERRWRGREGLWM